MVLSRVADTEAVTKKVLQWPLKDLLETNVLSPSNWTKDTKKREFIYFNWKKKKKKKKSINIENVMIKL